MSPPQQIPYWIQAYTTTTGMPDPRRLSRRARPVPCRDCRATILEGLDADVCAGVARVDPHRADLAAEIAAVLCEIPTYELWGPPGVWELEPRHIPRLPPSGERPPAGQRVVVIAHRCGFRPIATAPLPGTGRTARIPVDAPPPF